jgi:hypothetical protein
VTVTPREVASALDAYSAKPPRLTVSQDNLHLNQPTTWQ